MRQRLIYISGIGADKRAFSNLRLTAELGHIYVDWLTLENKNEPFEAYCNRIIQAYDIRRDDCLIGLSFGGLIAQQIARILGNRKVVLISSFRNKNDLQPLMTFGLKFKLYKVLPSYRIPLLSDFVAFFLNSWENNSRVIIKEMLKTADFQFINWSIRQIDQVNLSESFSPDFLSFTGTSDKLVSNWESENHISIENGSHFMLYDHAEEISEAINRFNSEAEENV